MTLTRRMVRWAQLCALGLAALYLFAIAFALAHNAFADAVQQAAPAGYWSPGDLFIAICKILLPIFGALLVWVVNKAADALFTHAGIKIDANARATVQDAVMNAAGRLLAAEDHTFATMKIPVDSPLILKEIPVVTAAVSGAMDQLGLTPEAIGQMIAGKIGQLQAQALSVPVTKDVVVAEPAKE